MVALEDRHAFFALLAADGVLAVAEIVLDHAVDDDDPQLLGIQRHELLGEVAAIEHHRVPGPGGGHDHLVHDPAGNLGIFVLGLLADQGQAIGFNLQSRQKQKRPSDGDLDGGAAGQPAADRQGIADQRVHAGQGNARP